MTEYSLYKSIDDGTLVAKEEQPSFLNGQQFTQGSADTTWIINHSNNTTDVIVQVYINNILTTPQSIQVEMNRITITFGSAVDGFANVLIKKDNTEYIPF